MKNYYYIYCILTLKLEYLYQVFLGPSQHSSWHPSNVPLALLSVILISSQRMEIARGIPLYKGKGDRSSPSNYRMISITTVVARLFERLILDRCLAALPTNFLSTYQAGFRKAHSTSHLLFLLTTAIKKSLGSKRCLPVCFLDISRAFDSVWLNGLY